MLFRPLVSKIWARTDQNDTFFDRHLECAIQTELVVEPDIPFIGRKQSCRFQYNSVVCQKDKSSRRLALCQGQRSRRVKNRTNPNKRVKTFSCDFPKFYHSNPNSFGANVHLRPNLKKTVKVIERSGDVTPKYDKLEGHTRSPCTPKMVQFWPVFTELWHSGEKKDWHVPLFFDRQPS